ncbi:caldesmon-like [Polistes fuscatus]|uniref:caldesmon-like n=1 Tax=Polistes fuscatus TaxID=30207 RepID=UPI001CA83310|nr:caldesmon-like [Polistes fuscatus]
MPSRIQSRSKMARTRRFVTPKSSAVQFRTGAVGSKRVADVTKKDTRVSKHPGISKTSRRDKIIQRIQISARYKKQDKFRVKTWLETPADWARFDAWAKINAQPRKYPEPEPIIRPSKSLHLLKKRINLLSKFSKRGDMSKHCKPSETKVSRAALLAVTTKRLLELSVPNLRMCDYGRELPIKIRKATLYYIPTERINHLSQPRIVEREECKSVDVPRDTKDKRFEKKRLLELTKKLADCPEGLTDQERNELFTAAGIKRSALEYKITSWTKILALPAYAMLKPRYDKDAKKWKKILLENFEIRGKKALEEQQRRIEGRKKKKKDTQPEKGEGDEIKTLDEEGKDLEDEKKKKNKINEAEKKLRKRAKHAWRYAPLPCKTYKDAFVVKQSALNVEASPRTIELAKSKARKDLTTKKEPFAVKKSALSATSTGRINELASPNQPKDPVEKPPPREKNKYDQPIYPKPKYGKVLPKTKPYKMGECPKEEDKKETKKKKERPIDPIVYQPTIDPCIDLEMARKQTRERKRAEQILKMKRQQRKTEQEEEKKVENEEIEKEDN